MAENVVAEVIPADISNPSEEESFLPSFLPELPAYLEKDLSLLKVDEGYRASRHCRVFTADEKANWLRAYSSKGGSYTGACEAIGANFDTVYLAISDDQEWQRQFRHLKLAMGDGVQSFSYKMALTPKGTTDRMAQLRRFFPSVYRNSDTQVNVGVAVNFRPWRRKPA